MTIEIIETVNAPKAIGPYSQAVKVGNIVYFSGQIPLNPINMTLETKSFESASIQVFENLKALTEAANGSLKNIIKMTIYLTDLADFAILNETMMKYFEEPYPARTTIQVSALPKGAPLEIDAIMVAFG